MKELETPFPAVVGQVNPEEALEALTIEPAEAIGIGDRVGSLEAGKDADLVLWTGDPLDPRSHVLVTICNGRVALDQDGATGKIYASASTGKSGDAVVRGDR